MSLKFVVHYGYFDEIRIAQFTKLSGPDMVIAHRLLKNNVPDTEYILLTDDYLKREVGDESQLEWCKGANLYNVIGKVGYEYAQLGHLRNEVSSPESREDLIKLFGLARSLEFDIAASLSLVHHVLTDNSEKVNFVDGLKSVEVNSAINRVGSSHICEFDGDSFDIQTLQDVSKNEDITYIEKAHSINTGMTMLAYYELKKQGEERTKLIYRGLTGDRKPLPEAFAEIIYKQAANSLNGLKLYVESLSVHPRKAG